MSKDINGTLVSEILYDELNKYLLSKGGFMPRLVDISVGNDFGVKMYADMKKKKLETTIGYDVESRHYDDISLEELLKVIGTYNKDNKTDGIMIQLPLPECLKPHERVILDFIDFSKDVDGMTSTSLGRLMVGDDSFEPCTAKGIITLLKVYDVNLIGKNVCIINRSNIVGKPLGQLFLREDATLFACHSKTQGLSRITNKADIVVAAMNKPEMIDATYIKDDAVVIDVGVHRKKEKIVGDVDYDDVYDISSLITPSVGGVGPMTICMLAYNIAKAKYGEEVDKVLDSGINKAKIRIKELK